MTRINVVPVSELCDQHLLAEFRELTRIPNCVLSGKLQYHYSDRPLNYTLGAGHVKFFTNKLGWLLSRYNDLFTECQRRGFKVVYIFPVEVLQTKGIPFEQWEPDETAKEKNRQRIAERRPRKERFTGRKENDESQVLQRQTLR
jgi:hypothetical protein